MLINAVDEQQSEQKPVTEGALDRFAIHELLQNWVLWLAQFLELGLGS